MLLMDECYLMDGCLTLHAIGTYPGQKSRYGASSTLSPFQDLMDEWYLMDTFELMDTSNRGKLSTVPQGRLAGAPFLMLGSFGKTQLGGPLPHR